MNKDKSKNKKVMVFGTFDIVHKGHIFFLKKAKKLGTYLIVIVARDINVYKFKNRKTKYTEKQRLEDIKKLEIADLVVLGDLKDFMSPIIKYKPHMIAIGYDQKIPIVDFENKIKTLDIKIKKIPSYKAMKYKSSIIRNALCKK